MSFLSCQFQVYAKPVISEGSRELIQVIEKEETKDSQGILASLGTEYLCSHQISVSCWCWHKSSSLLGL